MTSTRAGCDRRRDPWRQRSLASLRGLQNAFPLTDNGRTMSKLDTDRPPGRLLTAQEADLAFYVDFEGRQDEAPALLGVLNPIGDGSRFRQTVLDERFRSAAAAKGLPVEDIGRAIDALAGEIDASGACVVAWSTHEWDVFSRYASDDATTVLRKAFRNGIPLARKWRAAFAPDWTPPKSKIPGRGRHSLAAYMARLGYEVPAAFGPNNTGQRLKAVKEMLEARGDYSRLTPTVKGKWTKVLRHNEHDCRGMQWVCTKTSSDLWSSEPDCRESPEASSLV